MSVALIEKYDRRAPRYTSYPTAPHFHEGVDAALYAQWLTQPWNGETSLYVHIPFCAEMCWYCGCNTQVVNNRAPIEDYVAHLLKEIEMTRAALGRRPTVGHLHFGGGTPNQLAPEEFHRIVGALRDAFVFVDGAEIAVELDPRTVTAGFIDAMVGEGVSRVSIGVQDFSPDVQALINRRQPYWSTADLVDDMRRRGVAALNVDLMYGLPKQTVQSVVETVDKALALQPNRLTLFGYAHVPWMKKHQTLMDEQLLPNAEERWKLQRAAADRLARHGYIRIGLDHFARSDDPMAEQAQSGALRRNFQGYTTDQATALIGFGASAIGALPQGYVQNAVRTPDWRAAINAGRFAIVKGRALTDDDRLRRSIIEQLMCALQVDLEQECAPFGRSPKEFADALADIDDMVADGLAERSGHKITVTEAGRPLVRAVAAAFDAYLDRAAERHSRLV